MLVVPVRLTKSMRYYSGKGDNGNSQLFSGGELLAKSEPIFEVLGSLDELNSYLGLCSIEAEPDSIILREIKKIQESLFICQAHFAKADNLISPNLLSDLELSLEKIAKIIKPRDSFVISGGTRLSALLDVARTLARKCERCALLLNEKEREAYEKIVFVYLNRLSSYLYVLARYANDLGGVCESSPQYK